MNKKTVEILFELWYNNKNIFNFVYPFGIILRYGDE